MIETLSIDHFHTVALPTMDEIWVIGESGTVLLTDNGGISWSSSIFSLDQEKALNIRDIHAFSADRAFLLSVGYGNHSQIHGTVDGGKTWFPAFINADPSISFRCLSFDSHDHGMAVGGTIDGKPRLIETIDGGVSFEDVTMRSNIGAISGKVKLP
jgi:photosystem II stability/assembly factor-like uncharacterized protein